MKYVFNGMCVIAVILSIYLILSYVYSSENYVQIFGERISVVESNNDNKTLEISFFVRNNTDKHIIHFCYIPHFYNQYGEVFQSSSPGVANQFCHELDLSPGERTEFTTRVSDYSGTILRCDVESVFFLLSD